MQTHSFDKLRGAQMMITNKSFGVAISEGFSEAKRRGNPRVTAWHLIFGLVREEKSAALLRGCGASITELTEGVNVRLDGLQSGVSTNFRELDESAKRTIHRTFPPPQGNISEKRAPEKERPVIVVTSINLLLSLLMEPEESDHLLALQKAGVTVVKVTEVLSAPPEVATI